MANWLLSILARAAVRWHTAANKSLLRQLHLAKAEAARIENNYLVLVDDHADLRNAYQKLAFERLAAWGIDKDPGKHAPRRALSAPEGSK